MTEGGPNELLKGFEFLEHAWSLEDRCQVETDSHTADIGNGGRSRLDGIGTVLAYLSGMGSCFWGCSNKDHAVVYLCARAASNGHAAVRLLRMGYYDESLLLSRGIGEIANLLVLFCRNHTVLAEYRKSREGWEKAWRRFTPAEVRRRLKNPPIDTQRYYSLSARSAHARPDLKPQSFNFLGRPSTGMIFQQIGLLVCLNELIRPLTYSCLSAVSLLDIDDEVKRNIEASAEGLLNQVGQLDLSGLEEMYSLVTIVTDNP